MDFEICCFFKIILGRNWIATSNIRINRTAQVDSTKIAAINKDCRCQRYPFPYHRIKIIEIRYIKLTK